MKSPLKQNKTRTGFAKNRKHNSPLYLLCKSITITSARLNLLFLNTHSVDYSQDILYAGLRKRKDITLYELPFNTKYHLPLKKYPRNLGLGYGHLLKAFFQRVPWSEIDVAVIGGCNPDVLKLYHELFPKLSSHTKLILIDGGDWPEIGGDFYRAGGKTVYEDFLKKHHFDRVFKREMVLNLDYAKNVIPFPFGFNVQRVPKNLSHNKKYDVSFWAVQSSPIRTVALEMLADQFDCKANGTVVNQVFGNYKRKGENYLRELAACKVVINLRGVGWDTLRYWETPALGTFLISQPPHIHIPHNFIDGQEIVFCKHDLSDLIDLCDYYLKHETEREQIAKNGERKLRTYHSEDCRATYFLDEISKII